MLAKPAAGILISLLALAGCLLMFLFVPIDVLSNWTREDAFFEIGSFVGYWVAALICLFQAYRGYGTRFYTSTALLLFLFGARELDWHKRFTTASILKLNYYLKMQVPTEEKLIAIVVVTFILVFTLYYIVTYFPTFMRNLRGREASAITVCCLVVVLVFTKIVDRYVNILQDDVGFAVSAWEKNCKPPLRNRLNCRYQYS
jgi:hypothetical protein